MTETEKQPRVDKMAMVRENERLTDAQKWEKLSKDEKLREALEYIQMLMDVSAFPGGPTGRLETEVRRGLVNLTTGVIKDKTPARSMDYGWSNHDNE